MKRFTHLSSNTRFSASLFSRQFCRSFNSPRRDVTWALRASLSFVSYKHKDDDPSSQTTANAAQHRKKCMFVPEQSPSLSVWAEPQFCPSEQSSSEDSPASPEVPCTYITAKTETRLTAHLTAVHHQMYYHLYLDTSIHYFISIFYIF